MGSKWNFLALAGALCVAMLSGCASGDVQPFETPVAPVRDYAELRSRLEQIAASGPRITALEIGTIAYGEFTEPMLAVRVVPDGVRSTVTEGTLPRVLVIGGVHGNEPAGAAWAIRLIEQLAEAPDRYGQLTIDIVPVVNPWGWAHDLRYNADGRDINRDFASFRTQEAELVRAFTSDRDYDFVIDHHEDPDAEGFYLYQYGLRNQDSSRQVIADVRASGMSIEQNVNMIILSTDDGLIDAPMWGLRYMRLTGQLSVTNYMRLRKSGRVFTVETPTAVDMISRVDAHELAFEQLVRLNTQQVDMEGSR